MVAIAVQRPEYAGENGGNQVVSFGESQLRAADDADQVTTDVDLDGGSSKDRRDDGGGA